MWPGINAGLPGASTLAQRRDWHHEAELGRHPTRQVTFVGSSLGGLYATWLGEKHHLLAILINPAITSKSGLRSSLGKQRNLYSGETYELTDIHLAQLQRLYIRRITPARYLLLVEIDDEVVDHRQGLEKYRGSCQVVVQGGATPCGVFRSTFQ